MAKFNINTMVAALNKKAEKAGNKSVLFRMASEKERIKTISTGSYTYDAVCGGGIPENRVTEIYGPESSGKSTLCLAIIANAQKAGYNVFFFDAEGTIDFDFGKIHGIDKENLVYNPTNEIDYVFDYIQQISSYLGVSHPEQKVLAVIDSIATLVDNSGIENAMGDSEMAVIARKMGKGLRKIVWLQNKYENLTLICTNQTRDDFNKFVMPGMPKPKTTPGGSALKFTASLRLEMKQTVSVKEEGNATNIIGCEIKVKCEKNKIAPPKKSGTIKLYFDKGFDKFEEMFAQADALGILRKEGNSYYFKDYKVVGKNNFQEKIREDEQFRKDLHEAITEFYHGKIIEKDITSSEFNDFEKVVSEDAKLLDKIIKEPVSEKEFEEEDMENSSLTEEEKEEIKKTADDLLNGFSE